MVIPAIKYRKSLSYLLSLALMAACHPPKAETFTVEGRFTGAPGETIMLAELPFNQPQRIVLDSATLDSTGRFKLFAVQDREGIYQLFIENGPGILLINDTTDIIVHASTDSLHKYEVKQSRASKSIKGLYEQLTLLQERAAAANKLADSISNTKMPDSLKMPYLQAVERRNKAIADFLVSYLNLEKNGTAAWFALGVASRFLTKEQWAVRLGDALANHPRHPGLNQMKAAMDKVNADIASGVALLNKPLPEITLADTSGKPVPVSNFRGRWLLVHFWAAGCAACRAEHPNLVTLYNSNRSKNFSLLGISLDTSRGEWTKAIRQDSLIWTQTGDLNGWESPAVKTLGFKRLPFNMLVDPSGEVVAVNLHGEALEEKLLDVLK